MVMLEGFTCNPVVCRKDAAPASKRIEKDAAAAAAAAAEGTGNESGATAEHITAL